MTLKTLWILTKHVLAKPYTFLVVDATLVSENLSHCGKNLLERIQKLILKTDNKSRVEKIQ